MQNFKFNPFDNQRPDGVDPNQRPVFSQIKNHDPDILHEGTFLYVIAQLSHVGEAVFHIPTYCQPQTS